MERNDWSGENICFWCLKHSCKSEAECEGKINIVARILSSIKDGLSKSDNKGLRHVADAYTLAVQHESSTVLIKKTGRQYRKLRKQGQAQVGVTKGLFWSASQAMQAYPNVN